MVEVHGGSSAKKVRHNKVSTAKGPRDRRLRLSADTAIKFYDVQDRLGYERASEAVDWLIQNAKSSIDKLLIESSSSQPFELQTPLGAQNESHYGDHHTKSLFEEAANYQNVQHNRVQNLHSCMDGSFLFPYSHHMGNCSSTVAYCDQQMLEKGQIQRMSNSVPFFLQQPSSALVADKNEFSSVQESNEAASDDQLARYYISAQSREYQEQIEAFTQPYFERS